MTFSSASRAALPVAAEAWGAAAGFSRSASTTWATATAAASSAAASSAAAAGPNGIALNMYFMVDSYLQVVKVGLRSDTV